MQHRKLHSAVPKKPTRGRCVGIARIYSSSRQRVLLPVSGDHTQMRQMRDFSHLAKLSSSARSPLQMRILFACQTVCTVPSDGELACLLGRARRKLHLQQVKWHLYFQPKHTAGGDHWYPSCSPQKCYRFRHILLARLGLEQANDWQPRQTRISRHRSHGLQPRPFCEDTEVFPGRRTI